MYQCAMSAPIPPILPKLLALAGSPNPFEATLALRKARSALEGNWSVVTDFTKWMIDDRRLARLLDRAATADGDQSARAWRDAQRMMGKVAGLDFQFLSRKVAELQKPPSRIRIASKQEARAEPPTPRVTEATWAEVFAACAVANRSRAAKRAADKTADKKLVKFRGPRRPAPAASGGEQLSFDFGDVTDVVRAAA